jgi:Domain of unknown function (DUF4337)
MPAKETPNVGRAAVTAAVLAAFAAISSLRAGYHANAAILDEMRATDAWAMFQSKTIKADLVETRVEVLRARGIAAEGRTEAAIAKYEEEKREISRDAAREQQDATEHMERHESYAKAVTTFQVGIAMCAIAVLASKNWIFRLSLVLGVVGIGLLLKGAI